jgi:hypothetical protein
MLLADNFIFYKYDYNQILSFKQESLIKKIVLEDRIKIITPSNKKNFLEFEINENLLAIGYNELSDVNLKTTFEKKLSYIEKKAPNAKDIISVINQHLQNKERLEQLNVLSKEDATFLARIILNSIDSGIVEFFLKERGEFFFNFSIATTLNYADFASTFIATTSLNSLHYNGSCLSIILNLNKTDINEEKTQNEILLSLAEQFGKVADFKTSEQGKINSRFSTDLKFIKPDENLQKLFADDFSEIFSLNIFLKQNNVFNKIINFEQGKNEIIDSSRIKIYDRFKDFRNTNAKNNIFYTLKGLGFSFVKDIYDNYPYKELFFTNLLACTSEMIYYCLSDIERGDYETEEKFNQMKAIRLHLTISLIPAFTIKWGKEMVASLMKNMYYFYNNRMLRKFEDSYEVKTTN